MRSLNSSGILGAVTRRMLAERATRFKPSPTLAITGKARELRAAGRSIVSFAAGEPDFNTPEAICDAAAKAMRDGFTKYTASCGIPELREAIAEKLLRDNGVSVRPSQVVVSCGAKHSVYNALMTLLDPGDEVLLLAPYWMTYADQVELAGGVPVVVATRREDGFVPDLDAIRGRLTPRTRALIVNSPCNPTGAIIPEPTLASLAELAVERDLWIISDEIYENLVYEGQAISVASLGSEVADRTVTVNGCSKSYAMTGWRIGYAAAPEPVAKAMSNLQDQVTSNPTSFAQLGALAALRMPQDAIDAMRETFRRRRDLMLGLVSRIPGVSVSRPAGAFYLFPDVTAIPGGTDDAAMAEKLLDEEGVATISGTVFGGPGHLRLTYAASQADIEEGVGRIARWIVRQT